MLMLRMTPNQAESVVNHAATRILDGKEPYPLIVLDAEQLATFRNFLAGHGEYLTGLLDKPRECPLPASQIENGESRREATRPGRIPILFAEAGRLPPLDPDSTKLYLRGHGSPELDGIVYMQGTDELPVSSTQIASELSDAGLHPAYRNFRMITCFSASRLSDAGTPSGQRLADALGEAGFAHAEVTAYDGELMTGAPRLPDGKVHRQVRVGSGLARSSTVRQVFRPLRSAPQRLPAAETVEAPGDASARAAYNVPGGGWRVK